MRAHFCVLKYPNFDTGTFQNDLSIIKLTQDVPESETVNFLCLTNKTSVQPGSSVYAVGWGYTLENFSSGTLVPLARSLAFDRLVCLVQLKLPSLFTLDI